jgi:hypothetical protein
MVDILELAKNTRLKTDRLFLELFYNANFIVETDKLRFINSAYKFKDQLNLKIVRRDYSNTYDITMEFT